jgi:hypothetical protein
MSYQNPFPDIMSLVNYLKKSKPSFKTAFNILRDEAKSGSGRIYFSEFSILYYEDFYAENDYNELFHYNNNEILKYMLGNSYYQNAYGIINFDRYNLKVNLNMLMGAIENSKACEIIKSLINYPKHKIDFDDDDIKKIYDLSNKRNLKDLSILLSEKFTFLNNDNNKIIEEKEKENEINILKKEIERLNLEKEELRKFYINS